MVFEIKLDRHPTVTQARLSLGTLRSLAVNAVYYRVRVYYIYVMYFQYQNKCM